jgi:replication factor A1
MRTSRYGIELHAGSLTNISANPKNMGSDLPEVKENLIKISDLKPGIDSVSLICRVNLYYPPVEFQRSDGNTGTRASFTAEDDTGKARVVLWDRSAKTEIARGDIVKIENAYTKEGMTGEVELQAGNRSRIMKSDKKLKLPKLPEIKESYKINEITAELRGFNVVARVIQVFDLREYGESGGKLGSMVIGDETGTIRVVMWDEKSEITASLKKGDAVKLKNAYTKENLSGVPEIHIGRYSEISITDEKIAPIEKIEKSMIEEKNISGLKDGDVNVKITGEITDIDEGRRITFMTCPECKKKVQNLGGEWFCEACGDITPVENLVVSATVEDKTGGIKIVVFRENAEKILGMDVGEVMNIIGETQDEYAPVKQIKTKIIGKKVSLTGKARFSDFSEQLEFVADSVE